MMGLLALQIWGAVCLKSLFYRSTFIRLHLAKSSAHLAKSSDDLELNHRMI